MNECIIDEFNNPHQFANLLFQMEKKFFADDKGFKAVERYFKDFAGYFIKTEKYLHSVQLLHNSIPDSSYSLMTIADAFANELKNLIKNVTRISGSLESNLLNPLRSFSLSFNLSYKNCPSQYETFLATV